MKKDEFLLLPIYKQQKGKYITKKDIVTNFPHNFNIKDYGDYEYATTSGTTSDRMEIIRKPGWWTEEYERTYSNNKKLSEYLEKKLNKVIFTTAQCSNLICFIDKPPLEKRIIKNTLYVNNTFNPWTWTKEDIKKITEEINYFKPYYLDADPIYLGVYLFLKKKYNIKTKLHVPNIITLSYEFVPISVRKYIEDYFKTDILNLYGTTEFGYLFLENEKGKMQLCKDLIDVNLLEINKEKNLYTVIIDSYKNEYMPLINYRVGDMVIATKEQVNNFKINYEVEKMAGREKDLINGNLSCSMIDEIVSHISNILFYQIYLISENKCIFKYITKDNSPIVLEEQEMLNKEFIKIGLDIDFSYSRVEEISPEMSGKFSIIKRGV